MNVFNVHSQKTPVAGKIEKIEYFHGRYLNASLDKASEQNERNAMTVVTEDGQRVCFVQIAGLVARRILCYRMVGDVVKKGERYGFIRFGSRVDVYLPMSAQVLVSIGEKTTGVETVIARLGEPVKLQLILGVLSTVEAGGIRGVAVKCLDITKNSDCEGSLLDCN